jgi:hypothetical protein
MQNMLIWMFKMKLKITCSKCSSPSVEITADEKTLTPMYKCNKCGHKAALFSQLGKSKDEVN